MRQISRLSLRDLLYVLCRDRWKIAAAALTAQGVQAGQRAVAMYGGHFLNDTEDEPWQLVHRARLASKFKRVVGQLAHHGVARGGTSAVRSLLDVQPVGLALEEMSARHVSLSVQLLRLLEDLERGRTFRTPEVDRDLALAFVLRSDARNYVVLGDPAARIRMPSLA